MKIVENARAGSSLAGMLALVVFVGCGASGDSNADGGGTSGSGGAAGAGAVSGTGAGGSSEVGGAGGTNPGAGGTSGTGGAGAVGGSMSCLPTTQTCTLGVECCTGLCNVTAGAATGTCGALPSGTVGGCKVAGDSCGAGTDCCSRVCAAAPGGGMVCQATTGCRLKGELCRTTADCCGGANNGTCGDNTVTCEIVAGTDPVVGRCGTPVNSSGGVPFGSACGGGDTAARENCCCDTTPKFNCCFPDVNGVNRCGHTVCLAAGSVCSFSAECCNDAPCVPDAAGVLHCGAMCVADGGTCTASGDCCAGLSCVVPIGALAGTCRVPQTPPPDGGTAMCAMLGQSCTMYPCCAGQGGTCLTSTGTACAGQAACTCQVVIP